MYKDEFPNYDDELWIPNGFTDGSWHNDACPHAEKVLIDTPELYVNVDIWQDYKNPDMREYDKRYALAVCVNYNSVFFYDTNDLEEIKKLVDANVFAWATWRKEK